MATIRIHDLLTGEIIDREMTDEELAQYETAAAETAAAEAAAAEKKETILAALAAQTGFTAEEIKQALNA